MLYNSVFPSEIPYNQAPEQSAVSAQQRVVENGLARAAGNLITATGARSSVLVECDIASYHQQYQDVEGITASFRAEYWQGDDSWHIRSFLPRTGRPTRLGVVMDDLLYTASSAPESPDFYSATVERIGRSLFTPDDQLGMDAKKRDAFQKMLDPFAVIRSAGTATITLTTAYKNKVRQPDFRWTIG